MNTLNPLGSVKSETELINHLFLMNDQPTTCPKCGARSEILNEMELEARIIQEHECMSKYCEFQFLVFSE